MTEPIPKLGPRHKSALLGIRDAEYSGTGTACTFRGAGGPAVPWRLMAGLVDRGLVRVQEKGRTPGRRGAIVWVAVITADGRKALGGVKND